jgi:hypothetical protein
MELGGAIGGLGPYITMAADVALATDGGVKNPER